MFPIVNVPSEAAELSEQMGTKFKFWYHDEHLGRTLFKEGRPGTGENWAEKLASELAELLGIPHAHYELAQWRNRQGVISPSLIPEGSRLIHGNELVGGKVTVALGEGQIRHYVLRNHIASRVFQLLKKYSHAIDTPQAYVPIDGVHSALGVFIGYLLFDAWIANQDRHEENWGIVRGPDGLQLHLSASYDHGSSLGRNETDERRKKILTTKDDGFSMEKYVSRARSAFYPNATVDAKVKTFFTLELFQLACQMDLDAGRAWQAKLAGISNASIQNVIAQIPTALMSDIAREFTEKLLKTNMNRLASLDIQ